MEASGGRMLTLDKLREYLRYGGDMDGWVRMAPLAGERGITEDEWRLIDELRMKLAAVATGLASGQFRQQVERELEAAVEDAQAKAQLLALARECP